MTYRHQVDDESLRADDEGWFQARCTCGWAFGPLTGMEEVADVLMEHAFAAGVELGAG
jgi:hypothetical protein